MQHTIPTHGGAFQLHHCVLCREAQYQDEQTCAPEYSHGAYRMHKDALRVALWLDLKPMLPIPVRSGMTSSKRSVPIPKHKCLHCSQAKTQSLCFLMMGCVTDWHRFARAADLTLPALFPTASVHKKHKQNHNMRFHRCFTSPVHDPAGSNCTANGQASRYPDEVTTLTLGSVGRRHTAQRAKGTKILANKQTSQQVRVAVGLCPKALLTNVLHSTGTTVINPRRPLCAPKHACTTETGLYQLSPPNQASL